MTESTFPKPQGLERDALYDAKWDLLDNGATTLPGGANPEKWISWLNRYEGFALEEIEIQSHDHTALILKLKD